jgi:type III secretory pathway component EscR
MGTEKTNLEKYLNLWNIFENEIKTSKKLQSNTLSGFAKYYEKNTESDEKNDYKRVYDRLKKMKNRRDTLKTIRGNTLYELESFYKVLREDYFTQELLEDESYEHWFD